MNEKLYNLDHLNMSEEELFSPADRDSMESERITAPRYSYWRSVFRVFFKKKINIVILSLLIFVILFAYVYPALVPTIPSQTSWTPIPSTCPRQKPWITLETASIGSWVPALRVNPPSTPFGTVPVFPSPWPSSAPVST